MDFLAGFRKVVTAFNKDPDELPGNVTERYWETLKGFQAVIWNKAIDQVTMLPVQNLPSPAHCKRICRELENAQVLETSRVNLDELKRKEMENRLQWFEDRVKNGLPITQKMKDRANILKRKLIEEFPAPMG